MRQLIVTEMITLDGIIDSPGGGEHRDAGWTFQDVEFDPAAYEMKGTEQMSSDALLLGRVSFQDFAPVWPSMTEEFPKYNAMPKYVVSTTLPASDDGTWESPHVLRSLDDVRALKETDGGPIIVHGSATLAQSLMAAGLVDRLHLLQFPLLLGHGKKLFADTDKRKLKLVEQEAYGNGIQKLVYDVLS